MPGAKALQSIASGDGLVLNDSTARTTVQSLAAVLDCIERLMSQSAALPVPMPAAGIAMLCSRILSVDDSLIATGDRDSGMLLYKNACLGGLREQTERCHSFAAIRRWTRANSDTVIVHCSILQWHCAGMSKVVLQKGSAEAMSPVSFTVQGRPHPQLLPTRCCWRPSRECMPQPTACSGF